jgi:hypothetical protein
MAWSLSEADIERVLKGFSPAGCAEAQEPIAWSPEVWEQKLGSLEGVPDEFVESGEIPRRRLLELGSGELSGSDELRGFFIAVMAWGYGRSGRGPWRVREMLQTSNANARIRKAVELVRSPDGATGSYRALSAREDSGLNWLGPSFGTKLLYFAGYETAQGVKPLILDRVVGRALDEFQIFLHYGGWDERDYVTYLRLSEEIATKLECEPHDVECWLFRKGRELSIL